MISHRHSHRSNNGTSLTASFIVGTTLLVTATLLVLACTQVPTAEAWQRSGSSAVNNNNNNNNGKRKIRNTRINSSSLHPKARANLKNNKHVSSSSSSSLPGPLQRHTRGGYTSGTASRSSLVDRAVSSLFTSSSTNTLAPPPSLLNSQQQKQQQQQQQQWYPPRPPLAPISSHPPPAISIDYESQGNGMIDGDLVLPSQQQHHKRPSYVEDLKRQVANSSRRAPDYEHESVPSKKELGLSRLDVAIFGTYFCNSMAVTLPVILMPLVAAEHVAGLSATSGAAAGASAAAVVATLASISTLGGGFGKLLNGFVCQAMGGKQSSALYLVALSLASFLLANSPVSQASWIMGLIEFFASIQWTACSLVLANHYERSPAKFAKGITILSLASTGGTLTAKMGGTVLLKWLPSWRSVMQVSGIMALLGAAIAKLAVVDQPVTARSTTEAVASKKKQPQQSIGQSVKAVLGNPLFWQVGIAHATAMLARTSDRILGAFFHQTTALPRSVCGGLTAFVTLGFVHGLCKGRTFHQLPDIPAKTRMLSKAYAISALSAVAMALCANDWVQQIFFPSQHVLAATIAAITGILASNISFQFYQIPAMVATTFFGKNKALCLSLFDALGFFCSAQIWATTGEIVNNTGQHGWTLSWLMLAAMFGAGGKTMMNVLPSVLHEQQQQQQLQRQH